MRNAQGRGNSPCEKESPYKVNQEITSPVVRVVGENITPRIVSLREALDFAYSRNLDLIEISPNANPPVCKVMDYQKYLYELKKKQKEIKAKSAKIEVKEIRLGPNTDEHDFNFKVRHAIGFLQAGNKVKVDVFFRGRSIMYKEQGEEMLARFAEACAECGKVDSAPKLEGKRMILLLSPKKS